MAKDKTFLAACRAQGATESTIAAAATTDLGAQNTPIIVVSGNTGITSFGSKANVMRTVRLTGVPVITNSANLVTGTGANIQGAPGDIFEAYSDNSGKWYITRYMPFGALLASGPQSGNAPASPSSLALASVTLTPGKWRVRGNHQAYGSGSNSFSIGKLSVTSGDITLARGEPGYCIVVIDTTSGVGFGMVETEITVSANTPVYLNASSRSGSDMVYGSVVAHRIY